MKKITLFLIISILLLTGCTSKKDKINTIMEKENNTLISINYPTTNIRKLDKKINDFVKESYNQFIKTPSNNIKELNIDYIYKVYNKRYVNVVLKKYENIDGEENKLLVFCYDKKKKRYLKIQDITNENEIIGLLKQELINKYKDIDYNLINETLDNDFNKYTYLNIYDNKLIIYFNYFNDYEFINLNIPLDSIKLNINYYEEQLKENEILTKVDSIIDYNHKVIALTFDDGPSIYTKEIIDILSENEANATFFVLGNRLDMYADIVKEAVLKGNEIGNHSYNHKWLSRTSIKELKYQIDTTNEKIKNITGYYPTYLRPTYGSVNNTIKNNTGMKIVLWDIDTKDWKDKSPASIADTVIDKARDSKIILMHDTHKRTVEALKIIVPELKRQGYQFVTLSELEEVKLLRKLNN